MSQASLLRNPIARPKPGGEHGISLIMVMLILVVVSLLGIGGVQVSMMGEHGARNDRDSQVAWQSAEAALVDAEFDMFGPGTAPRSTLLDGRNLSLFVDGCGGSGNNRGLCTLVAAGKPAWLTADFSDTSAGAKTTAFGTFTTRTFASGAAGIQPAQAPRYLIEPITDPNGDMADPTYLYRVTAMGYGPRPDIQAVVQMLYRKTP